MAAKRSSDVPFVRLETLESLRISRAVEVVNKETLTVTEFIGNVASGDPKLSAVLGSVTAPTGEELYIPEFDEYLMVISGTVQLHRSATGTGYMSVEEGESCKLPAGIAVKWSWPGPCKYVHLRMPAVTEDYHKRESTKAREVLPGSQKIVATASVDSLVKIWDFEARQKLRTLQGHGDQVMCVKFSRDGKRVVTASTDRTAKIWSLQSGECLETLVGHSGPVYSAAFSPDNGDVEMVVTASQDRTAMLWYTDTSSSGSFARLTGHSKQVHSADFSPSGRLVATASDDRTARLWEIPNGACTQVLTGHGDQVYCVSFTPEGRLVATASADKTAKLWDVGSGECTMTLSGHSRWVRHVAFNADGSRLITASGDSTVKIWVRDTGECQLTLEGHKDWVRDAQFSEDGAQVVSSSKDGTARIWCASSGCCLRSLGHDSWVRAVAFAPESLDHDGGSATKPPRFFSRTGNGGEGRGWPTEV